ncbi:MAG: ABC transporter permease [Aeromicrobium sp.]
MNAFAGTRTFVAFFLRRDRYSYVWWFLGGVILFWSQAVSVKGLYATQAEFDKAAASMQDNVAIIAMSGPARALNTVGGQVAWQASAFGAILAGLMSMFLIARHTRVEEESGREEMIRAGAVGRYAPVFAAVIVVSLANVVLGFGITGSLIAYGLPAAGSISLGLACALAGLVFMAVALLAAQLTESARSMYGIVGAVMAASYALRAIGDIGNGFFSWLSPIGWSQAMRAYAGEIWWPALVSIAATAVIGYVAFRVLDHRDVGAGVWPTRPGPAHGGASMNSAYGLAWRLQRGTVLGWTAGLFLMGIAYGSIGKDVGDLLGDSQLSKDMFAQGGGDLVASFYSTTALMLALIGSSFAISSALRLRSEESLGRVEALLSTALPRRTWAASHFALTVLGSVVVVASAGVGTGISYGLIIGDSSQIWRLTAAALVHIPAVLILAGVTYVFVGFAPRLAVVSWVALVFCLVVMMFGEAFKLPNWVNDISPFRHTPLLPGADFRLVPILTELTVAAVLMFLAYVGLKRRDLY